ncbi:hypothetical protein [Psychrobacter sanguinis]|uniref:hypothetical protein n=1 Tax=Psychrobacter sanguinis TaxID=861445 RepID=UPI001918F6DD|nr:hypothetical protein [Psychrobacter sanguinis]UEC25138.1 hypothetical protein LK453_11470 [Psychrobacter sanguinis]
MKKLVACLCFSLACMSTSHAETIAGYSFEKYPAKIYKGKKAPLKLGEWNSFRTRLKAAHKDSEINFAGNYIVTTWGCGTSCVSGAMIDKRTGKVYDIPLGETEEGLTPYESGMECVADGAELDDDERLAFYPNSRLFITRNCEGEKVNETTGKQLITYHVNIWDEKTKTFKLKKVNKSKLVKMDYSEF